MSEEDEKEKIEYDPEEDDKELVKLSKKTSRKNDENVDNQEEYNLEEDEIYTEEKPEKKKNNLIGRKIARSNKKKKKKKARNNVNNFIEREASEDENEEDSIVEGAELTNAQYDIEMQKAMKKTENRFTKINDENEEQVYAHIQNLAEEHQDEMDEEEINRLPTKDDPKMWIVKCRIGDEKAVVNNLYHKYIYFKQQNKEKKSKDKVKIFSITCFENLKGKIYIEAFTERDVQFAIEDMSNVNHNSIQLVPSSQRPQIFLYDQAPKTEVNKNQLVRIKGGNYDGDLAKVVYVEDPVNKIHVALVPRIIDDLKGKKGYNVVSFGKQKSFLRPRQKLFDKNNIPIEEYSNYAKNLNEPFGEVVKFHNFKFMDGLLIRPVKRIMLETENVSPKDEELEKIGCFKDEKGVYTDKNSKSLLKVANKSNVRFKKGDVVKIVSSSDDNLNDLQGVICEPEKGDLLKVEIVINGEKALYNMPKHELALVRHDFQNGNLVYAKYGSNKGKSGMIIQVLENGTITVYDSITKTKFEAKNTDLIYSEDMELDNEENEMFKIGELVKIKNSHKACYIIESTKFIIKVVTTNNEVKQLSVRDVDKITLGKKLNCIDSKGNPINLENSVKVIGGQYKGYKAVIKSIYGNYFFLLNYEFIRTNGIFCEIKENLELLGSEILRESTDKGRVNHRRIPNSVKDLKGKIVHITKGNWKGYNGILIQGNDKNAMIELIARQRTIEVPFDHFVKGDVNSAKENNNESIPYNNHGFLKTPAYYENKNVD